MCGICGIAGSPDRSRLEAMSAMLEPRGPAAAGEFLDGPLALASRRRSIIDLAGGDQPIFNEDGTCVVVQNGEIYNHPDLMRELQSEGHVYRTHSDTETLVHLYEQHDLDFARRLRGMFAVAIWDARRRRLILARDRYGIKPLYYRAVGGTLEFASELRALPRGEIDLDALEAFLAFNSIPSPYSIFRDVRKLPAGHLLVWEESGDVRLERYAHAAPVQESELRGDDEAELVEELRARMRDSVRAHLLADVPVGVGPLARLAAPLVERVPSSGGRASLEYRAKRFVRAAHLPPLERHHGWKEIFSADARAELTGRTSAFDPVDVYRARYAETQGAEELARLQDVDFAIYLVDDLLVKTDRASMAHSLEARVPFLDPVVTNFAFALPRRHRVRGLSKKVLLRKAAEPLLPREVVHGRKRGFSIPAAAWLRGELEPFARETLSAATLRRQGIFRPGAAARVIDDHVARRQDLSRQLWGLLAFTLWYERHVEGLTRDVT